MNFKTLVKKSVKAFYNGELPEEVIKASQEPYVYTKEFFDMLAEQDLEEVAPDEASD